MPQCPLHRVGHRLKCRRMGGVGQGVKEGGPFLEGQIQLPGGTVRHVNGDDATDLFPKWLDGD